MCVFFFFFVILRIEGCLECNMLFCVMCVMCGVCYCNVFSLYCTVLYCSLWHCSTLLWGINPFAVNNSNNNKKEKVA